MVIVPVVNPRHGRRGHGAEPGADLTVHLARHGVRVEVRSLEAREIDIAEVILSRLAGLGGDLLVMGACGHAWLRELVLGGVTRSTLDRATVPVRWRTDEGADPSRCGARPGRIDFDRLCSRPSAGGDAP